MNTPAHLLVGWAVCARNNPRPVILAALIGALMPDLSLYVMAGVSMYVLSIPPSVVFDELYFSDAWQTVFAVDNSFIVWGALFGLAIVLKRDWAIAFCGAALLHLAFDFPLHHDDGRAHFWPLTNWIFESPISYWDRRQHAGIVSPLELALAVGCAFAILGRSVWQNKTPPVALLLALEVVAVLPGFLWIF